MKHVCALGACDWGIGLPEEVKLGKSEHSKGCFRQLTGAHYRDDCGTDSEDRQRRLLGGGALR
jgi:hypothetical protein